MATGIPASPLSVSCLHFIVWGNRHHVLHVRATTTKCCAHHATQLNKWPWQPWSSGHVKFTAASRNLTCRRKENNRECCPSVSAFWVLLDRATDVWAQMHNFGSHQRQLKKTKKQIGSRYLLRLWSHWHIPERSSATIELSLSEESHTKKQKSHS